MLIAPVFLIIENWEQPKYPSISKGIHKPLCVHSVKYWFSGKEAEINPKGIMASDRVRSHPHNILEKATL